MRLSLNICPQLSQCLGRSREQLKVMCNIFPKSTKTEYFDERHIKFNHKATTRNMMEMVSRPYTKQQNKQPPAAAARTIIKTTSLDSG